MINELQVFKYNGQHQIRTTVIDSEVWFVAKDVCDVLGLADVTSALRTLDSDEKVLRKISGEPSIGGNPNMTTISEPGLYKLIMRSNKPEAKQFTRWVTHEVLPSIHRSGMYLSDQAADAYVNDPEKFRQMAERCSALERKVADMERRLNQEHPLSVFGQVMLANGGCITVKDAASFLSQHGVPIGQNRLYRRCREKKLLCSRKGRQWNRPTQRALDAGLFNVEVNGGFNVITMVTPQGLKHLTDELIAEQYPLLALLEDKETDAD